MAPPPGTPVFGAAPPGVVCRPRRAAYVVIRAANGLVAAIRALDRDERCYWLPGGELGSRESPEDAVCREVREELGRGIRLQGRIGDAVQYFPTDEAARWYEMTATFLRAEFDDERPGRSEHELVWLDVRRAAEMFYHSCHAWAAVRPR